MACFPSNKANVIMVAYGDCNSGVSPYNNMDEKSRYYKVVGDEFGLNTCIFKFK
jgi:hypothetical protein